MPHRDKWPSWYPDFVVKPFTLEEARAAKVAAKRELAGNHDVVGVGLTKAKGSYLVKINVRSATVASFPATIQGVPLVVEVVATNRKR